MVLAFCLSVCVIVSENERRKFFVGSVLGSPRLLRRRKFIFEVFRKPQRDNFSSCYSQLSVMSEKEKNNGSQCIQILWLIFFLLNHSLHSLLSKFYKIFWLPDCILLCVCCDVKIYYYGTWANRKFWPIFVSVKKSLYTHNICPLNWFDINFMQCGTNFFVLNNMKLWHFWKTTTYLQMKIMMVEVKACCITRNFDLMCESVSPTNK